jgi:hypothetical protein
LSLQLGIRFGIDVHLAFPGLATCDIS